MDMRTAKSRTDRAKGAVLPSSPGHGGRRAGAGRKPKGAQAGVPHRPREAVESRFPVHVTVKLRQGLPRLRSKREYTALHAACAAGGTGTAAAAGVGDFRLRHHAVQDDHLHLLVEGRDRIALARGLQGLLIRIAKALNKSFCRHGKVFADRYHDRILKTPREVRAATRLVLAASKQSSGP